MSMLPFGPNKEAKKYFQDRLGKLLRINDVRIMEILESFQYGIAYIFICFFLGVGLDFLFPKFDEKTEIGQLFVEVTLQCLALILFVFYGRKLAKVMPFFFFFNQSIFGSKGVPKYDAYKSTEYEGEVVIGFVLVATQTNLLKKIDKLSRSLYAWMYGEERDTARKIEQEVEKDGQLLRQKVDQEEKVMEKDFSKVVSDIKAIQTTL
jgi:hypothetical protein